MGGEQNRTMEQKVESEQTYDVLVQAWGPKDEPGTFRYRTYTVQATTKKQAKNRAVYKARDKFDGIIGKLDDHNVANIIKHD